MRGWLAAAMMAGMLWPATSAGADGPVVMPAAGVETDGPLPVRVTREAGAWPAGARRLDTACVTHLRDGTVLICAGRRLLAIGADGRVRPWGPVIPDPGTIVSAAAADDGTVVVLTGMSVRRLQRDGTWLRLMRFRGLDGAVAALQGGGAVVLGDERAGVIEVSPDGRRRVVLPRTRWLGTAVEPLADGALAVAASEHVLRVTRDGTVSELAGGEAPLVDGAPGLGTRLGEVTALSSTPYGGLLIAADAGLLELDSAGRLRILGGTPPRFGRVQPAAVGAEGAAALRTPLGHVIGVDALPSGEALVLLTDFARSRLVSVAPLDAMARLTVALSPVNRERLREGVAEIVSSAPAAGRIDVFRDRTLVATLPVALSKGTTRVSFPTLAGGRALTARIEVSDPAGRIAVHHLRYMPTARLGRVAMRRAADVIAWDRSGAVSGMDIDKCRRTGAASFRCRWEYFVEASPTLRGTAVLRLGDHGLIEYAERRRSGKVAPTRYLEPR